MAKYNFTPLYSVGISHDDAAALRRISMTLRRWFELECGDSSGAIEREEKTGKPFWYSSSGRDSLARHRYPVPDREAGAMRRLAMIMARYPHLSHYIQGDPRGAALYILRPGDVPEGKHAESYYSNGICVHE